MSGARFTQDCESGYLLDSLRELRRGLQHGPGGGGVARPAVGHQRGPGAGHCAAWPAVGPVQCSLLFCAGLPAGQGGRDEDAAGPVRADKVLGRAVAGSAGQLQHLVVDVLRAAVHDDAASLGRVPELVRVGRDAGHARQAEVKRLQLQLNILSTNQYKNQNIKLSSIQIFSHSKFWYCFDVCLCEGYEEAPQTSVDVDGDAEVEAEGGDLLHRVHDAVRVLWRTRQQHYRVGVARAAHVGHCRLQCGGAAGQV